MFYDGIDSVTSIRMRNISHLDKNSLNVIWNSDGTFHWIEMDHVPGSSQHST